MYCKKCGNSLKSGDKICSHCENPIEIESSQNIINNKKNNGIVILLTILVFFLITFLVYCFYIKYNSDKQITNDIKDNSVIDNVENDDNQDNNGSSNGLTNYILNDQLAHIYTPITDTKIKIEDSSINPAVIMEIDASKNVSFYNDNCGDNCNKQFIYINDEPAKYITYLGNGDAGIFNYIILTNDGNVYKGDITTNGVSDATKVETEQRFVNIVSGGYRVETDGETDSILGVASDNSYYNIEYCPNTKSGNYLSYIKGYDSSNINDQKNEYILIYNDGSISYLNKIMNNAEQSHCDNYDYYQYIVNSNNEKIQAQLVFYKDGFYILGTDGYLYELTSNKIENNYIAVLHSSKEISTYRYNQIGMLIDSITIEYTDNTNETFDNLQSRGAQIVMVKEK